MLGISLIAVVGEKDGCMLGSNDGNGPGGMEGCDDGFIVGNADVDGALEVDADGDTLI